MMVGFFVGITILLGGALLLVSKVINSVALSINASDRNTVHTQGGSFRLQNQDQVGPGLPVYPRASLELPEASSIGTSMRQAESGVSVSAYHTVDLRDFVDNWYSQHLSPEFKRRDSGDKPVPEIFKDTNVSDSDIAFVAERGAQIRIVALSLDEGGTKISLIRVDKSSAASSSAPTK